MDYQQQEYVLQFLMGLNESFTQVRAQVLMLDPLPSINKVFSLVVQDERQRHIGNSTFNNIDIVALGMNANTTGNLKGKGIDLCALTVESQVIL